MYEKIFEFLLTIFFAVIEIIAMMLPAVFSFLLFALMMFVLWVPVALFQGYLITLLWAWFIVPMGYAALNLKAAIGVSLIINLLTSHINVMSNEQEVLDHAFYWFAGQLMILIAAYFIKVAFV